MINIIYEDNHLLVVEKPYNMPMCQDQTNDLDLLTILKNYLKVTYQKPNNVYLALLHRLDRPVGGVCVFAKTSKAASRISKQFQNKEVQKSYLCIVLDPKHTLKDSAILKDYLLKNPKTNITTVHPKGKFASLDYQILKRNNELALLKVNLHTGRSHQIRVQFASRHYPLYGDHRYNPKCQLKSQIALYSHSLTFKHPITKEIMTFKLYPKYKPFNLFGGQYE